MQIVEVPPADEVAWRVPPQRDRDRTHVGVEPLGVDFPGDRPALLGQSLEATFALPQRCLGLLTPGDVLQEGRAPLALWAGAMNRISRWTWQGLLWIQGFTRL